MCVGPAAGTTRLRRGWLPPPFPRMPAEECLFFRCFASLGGADSGGPTGGPADDAAHAAGHRQAQFCFHTSFDCGAPAGAEPRRSIEARALVSWPAGAPEGQLRVGQEASRL